MKTTREKGLDLLLAFAIAAALVVAALEYFDLVAK